MAKKKSTAQQATGALYKSLGKPKARKATAKKPAATIPATRKPQPGRTVSHKLGITLFPIDLDCINEIAIYMQQHAGIMITRSDAIKIALRKVQLDKSMIAIYNEFKAEDGRRK
jgi:hypothetical protein